MAHNIKLQVLQMLEYFFTNFCFLRLTSFEVEYSTPPKLLCSFRMRCENIDIDRQWSRLSFRIWLPSKHWNRTFRNMAYFYIHRN